MKVVKIRTNASGELAFDNDQMIMCDQLGLVWICGRYGEAFVCSRTASQYLKFQKNKLELLQ